jgi:hypothetical protein
MSLDNVLGVAAAAKGNTALLVIGLAISIPLIIYGSTLILKLMNRFSFIVTAGGGLLGWVAGEMMISDPAIKLWVDMQLPWAHAGAPIMATLAVVGTGKWLSMGTGAGESSPQAMSHMLNPMAEAPALEAVPAGAAYSTDHHRELVVESVADEAAHRQAVAADRDQAMQEETAPPGYRWISRQWRTLPDGTRDYAATHGLNAFRSLAPMSSRLRQPPHAAGHGRKNHH